MNRKKKFISLLIITVMLLTFMPQTALAATTYTFDDAFYNHIGTNGIRILIYGEYVYVWSHYNDDSDTAFSLTSFIISEGDTFVIGDNAKVRMRVGSYMAVEDFNIVCGSNVTLVLEEVTIDSSNCALEFTGTGNTLELDGDSTITSGYGEAGICVEEGAELSICGSGSLNVEGGGYGAGIGSGGDQNSAGTITISECTINATGGIKAAGIGGGGQDSTIPELINGGTVTINSGYVYAKGDLGAGIGGGYQGDGGTVIINGGTVIADGSSAGIGGGRYDGGGGNGGDVTITGGVVFASGFIGQDIGSGKESDATLSEGTLEIDGDALVFLENDLCAAPTTVAHTHIEYTVGTSFFGYNLPQYWKGAGVYAITAALTYDGNGGTGGKTIIAPKETTQTVIGGSGLSKPGYTFVEWNSQKDGSGDTYEAGDSIVMSSNMTVYAIWESVNVTGVDIISDVEILSLGGIAVLTADVMPSGAADTSLSWTSSDESVATVDSRGVVTAVGTGSALITAESLNGLSDTCQVAVSSVLINYSLSTGSAMEMTTAVDPDATAVWTSDDETVATVDSSGKVTAKAPGIAMITVTAGGVSQTCGVTVYDQNVTSVKLSRASVDLTVNDSLGLTAYVDPDDAVNRDVLWTSSDEDVVTVNSSGTVTAMGSGSATILAQAGWRSASCSVTVTQPVTSVSIDSSAKTLSRNQTASLSATVLPSDATNANVTWTSSDTDIATVDANGKVIAKNFGFATITAEADGITAVCTVSVVKRGVTGVTLSSTSETLKKGATATLSATVSPSDATNANVRWTSSDTDIATVDANGKVIAKNFGVATITAEADGITAVCTVSVVKIGVTGVTLSSTSETLKKGATATLSAAVSPSDATNADVTWKSTNTSVARVDQSGKVTALADGSAAITVEADGKFAVCVVLVSSDEDTDNDATQTEKITPTATPLEAEPASSPTPVATAGDSGMTITPDIVKRDEQTGKITIELHINELPEGTSSIKLPDGEIIHVADAENGMISITVDENELDAAGDLQIIFLDDQEVRFGSASVEVLKNEGTQEYPSWLLWTIGVIGVSLIAASAVLHLRLKKRRNQKRG